MTKIIEIQGLDELIRALEKTPEVARPLAKQAMESSTRLVQDLAKEYPPATEANSPGRFSLRNHRPMGYYERGRGWWYPVMKRQTLGLQPGQGARKSDGKILATRKQRQFSPTVAGYKLIPSSEVLGKSWTTEVTENSQDGYSLLGIIGNNTSYARAVQGDRQAGFHAKRGWRNLDQIIDESEEAIMEQFTDAADELRRHLVEEK